MGEHREGLVEPELGVGLGGNREPEVELVVSQVVVGYARVAVDDLRRAVGILRIDLRSHEHRGVAERPRIEDRGDLTDDALLKQGADALHHLPLCNVGQLRNLPVWTRRDREAALHEVEQPAIELVERDRRAVLAATRLGRRSFLARELR